MNKKKVIRSAKEWFNTVPNKYKEQVKYFCTVLDYALESTEPYYLKEHIYECMRIQVTNQCANELQQHYRKSACPADMRFSGSYIHEK